MRMVLIGSTLKEQGWKRTKSLYQEKKNQTMFIWNPPCFEYPDYIVIDQERDFFFSCLLIELGS